MKRLFLISFLALVLSALPCQSQHYYKITSTSTGTVTLSYQGGNNITALYLSYVTDSSEVYCSLSTLYGELVRASFIPDSATPPTNNYDVQLLDSDGLDVLQGNGANLSSTTGADFAPLLTDSGSNQYIPTAVASPLVLSIENAGVSKRGAIRLYLRR